MFERQGTDEQEGVCRGGDYEQHGLGGRGYQWFLLAERSELGLVRR